MSGKSTPPPSAVRQAHKHRALYVGDDPREAAPAGKSASAWYRIDRFRAFVASGVASYIGANGKPVVERMFDPRDSAQTAAQKRILELLDRHVRVYAVSPQLMDAAMDATERAMRHMALSSSVGVPPWPMIPLWVEWPGAYLGSPPTDPAGFTVGAIMVTQERMIARHQMTDEREQILVTRVTLIGIDNTQKALLYLPDGTWMVEQTGPCFSAHCTIGRRATPKQIYRVSERADAREALECACQCHYDGQVWSRILWALMHLLSAHGVTLEEIDRHIPLPPKPKSPKQTREWQTQVNRAQAHNRSHPPIRHISWSALTTSEGKRWRRVMGEDGVVGLEYQQDPPRKDGEPLGKDAEVREGIVRRPHPRLLIADGTTRWTHTQVVAVSGSRPYSQRVRRNSGLGKVRLIVETNGLQGGPIMLDESAVMTDEQLRAMQEIMARKKADGKDGDGDGSVGRVQGDVARALDGAQPVHEDGDAAPGV